MNHSEITLDEMQKAIKDYPYLRQCFSDYLKWLFEECDENRKKYDALFDTIATSANSLKKLEEVFREFGKILALNEFELSKIFGFDNEDARHKTDIMKSADLLAEPWVALALQKAGFHTIRKVASHSKGYEKPKFSDFTASWSSTKFAIEVKNAREDEEFYKKRIDARNQNSELFLSELRGRNGRDSLQQEEEILSKRLERRISTEKERNKIIDQLKNTSEEENCSATMLVIYFEMSSGLIGKSWVIAVLEEIKAKYPVSDYFAYCANRELICAPQLP